MDAEESSGLAHPRRGVHLRFQGILGGVLAVGALALAPGAACADATDQTVAQINNAVAVEGAPRVVSNPDVSIPATGAGLVTLGSTDTDTDTDAGQVIIDLPAHGAADRSARTTLFEGDARGADIAAQPTENGVRALVHIDSAAAPERYPFGMGGDVVRLERQRDGSVSGYGADGQLVTHIAPPWARDANGRDVPTFYEIKGTTLVQIVRHHGGRWAYGITADPNWWKVAKCVAAIVWVVGSSVFAVSKIIKIRGAIRALGGFKNTAKLLVGATSWSEKLARIGGVMAGAAAYFLGIDTIRKNC